LRPLDSFFPPGDHPDLLVGLNAPDDCAVWRLDDERALVFSADFFTPIVDDPYNYGAIAAANSLSDIYAMGGKPFLALNIAALPPNLPVDFLGEIMHGGAEKCREAGVVVAGGHTVRDKEPKFGFAVLGFAHPQHVLTKGGCQPGDVLLLSKPLGSGTLMTALKNDKINPALASEAIAWMKRLNQSAAQLALDFGAHACTDVTGFSLLGHGWEMAFASHTNLRFHFERIPCLPGAKECAAEFIFPGGAHDNRLYFGEHVRFAETLGEDAQLLLFDPQTSGGLLFAVAAQSVPALLQHAAEVQQPLWEVGEVLEGSQDPFIYVI